jgi:hypothetical protein
MLRHRWSRFLARGCGAVLIGTVGSAWAEQALPALLEASLIVRVLAYDRALKARAGGSVTIGILFKGSDRASARAQGEMLQAFGAVEPRSIQGIPFGTVSHAYKDRADLSAWAARDKIGILYVAPGLADELDAIRDLSRERKLVTVSPVRSFVERGLAVGTVPKGNKAGILVNLGAAELLGMDLDPKLLQLAEVLR